MITSFKTIILIALLSLILVHPLAVADDEIVYGRQLMTEQELAEHRAKMRSFRTEEEQETYRREHHERMQERARKMGVTIPDEPGQRSKGTGSQERYGPGMGPGSGRGMGGGRR